MGAYIFAYVYLLRTQTAGFEIAIKLFVLSALKFVLDFVYHVQELFF
jgi:hypothetical protein